MFSSSFKAGLCEGHYNLTSTTGTDFYVNYGVMQNSLQEFRFLNFGSME